MLSIRSKEQYFTGPFNLPLKTIHWGDWHTIMQFNGDKNLFVRENNIGLEYNGSVQNFVADGEREIVELRQKYGLSIPRHEYVIGQEIYGRPGLTLYTLVERVKGVEFRDIKVTERNVDILTSIRFRSYFLL